MKPQLSKSDFKLARDCASKLWYKKQGYPSSMESDEYMMMLADGGYMVGKMAQLLYPSGITIEGRTDASIERTEQLLNQKEVILFEPAIQSLNKLIRIDILVKKGNHFQLIEVKSKSFDSVEKQLKDQDNKKYFNKDWDSYLEDIAFQKMVLQEKFPKAKIDCYLLMPDKSKTTSIEGLINWFKLKEATKTGSFRNVEVEFTGDLQQLQKGHILDRLLVNNEVEAIIPRVKAASNIFIQSLKKQERIVVPISCACKGCEYSETDENHKMSGFETCWGKLAHAKDKKGNPVRHILELNRLGNINRSKEGELGIVDTLISQGKIKLSDIPEEAVHTKAGLPSYNSRPLYQLKETREFLKPEFYDKVRNLKYPLHFIDFETSQMAIPYHAGLRPYEKVMFQWSCHTIAKPGAEPVHEEWINTDETYPNLIFARSLMEHVGRKGTLMTWSAYENTQLKNVFQKLEELGNPDPELSNWLEWAAAHTKGDDSMIVDMNELCLHHYFHPYMGGRTSIKVTLPAVLQSTTAKKIINWLKAEELYDTDEDGEIINPYELLPPFEIFEKAERIKDGAGAMRGYQDMLYGKHSSDPVKRELYKKALLKYCKLDTLAMVVIWEHWIGMNKL